MRIARAVAIERVQRPYPRSRTRCIDRASVLPFVLFWVLQGCTQDAASDPRASSAGDDLSAQCERMLAQADAESVRPLGRRYTPDLTIGDEAQPIGRVIGAAWIPSKERLYVLDGINQRVAIYDATGDYVGSFGRRGEGPGEFEELGAAHGSRLVYNQLSRLGDDHLVVSDLRFLHVFDGAGSFIGRTTTSGARAGPHAIRHVAPISDSTVLFAETGAMQFETSDPEVRTGVRLVETFVRNGTIDTTEWARMRNSLHRFPPFERMPPRDPYGSYFRRTWDAVSPGLLVITSQTEHGVCFFDRDGRAPHAYRLDAPVIPVDQGERNRIRDELRSKMGPTVPIVGGSSENFYRVWPRIVPPSVDVVLAPDSTAWVERILPDHSRAVDLYHTAHGYLGSIEPIGERLPIAFARECAFVVDEEIPVEMQPDNFFYGLRRWCPAIPASPAMGRVRSSPQQGSAR